MSDRQWFWLGVGSVIAGLAVIVAGTISPARNIAVALGWLLITPLVAMLLGAVCIQIGLLRHVTALSRQDANRRILAAGAVAGVALSAGFAAAGGLSQIPDWISGANGAFRSGPEGGEGALIIVAVGLAAGFITGGAVAVVRSLADRHGRNARRIAR